mmetsp:Transcript_53139/g.124389  ORF Transcript_53139/g.124389 Transcript_53139/m.124389 type:complete len:405 (+) Transcript_53139:1635-2849(+)
MTSAGDVPTEVGASVTGEVGSDEIALRGEEHVEGLLGFVRRSSVLESDLPFLALLAVDLLGCGGFHGLPRLVELAAGDELLLAFDGAARHGLGLGRGGTVEMAVALAAGKGWRREGQGGQGRKGADELLHGESLVGGGEYCLEAVAPGLGAVLDFQVLVGVPMRLDGETQVLCINVVVVAVQLHQQQQATHRHQRVVSQHAEACKRLAPTPDRQQADHDDEGRDLAQLYADVEAEDAHQHAYLVVSQRQLLQPRRQAEAVQQAEAEDDGQQVGRGAAEVLLETAVVVETLVDHADGDQRIDQPKVPRDLQEGRQDQRDAVAEREGGDELGDIHKPREEEHHAEQEEQVVIAGQHVAGSQADVLQVSAIQHALLVGFRDAMGPGGQRGEEQAHRKQRPGKESEHE